MKFTQVAANAFEKLQLNAGVLLTEFNPSTGELDREKIFGATTGGTSFTASAEYIDFGEDIDNVPANTKELKKLDSITATMSGTFLTVDTDTARRLIGAADTLENGKVLPRVDLKNSDFFDVWWVGDYSNVNTGENAGFIAIKLINALSTGGFQIQSSDAGKGNFAFEFTGHYTLADITIAPFEIYIQDGVDEEAAALEVLSLGSLTLVPSFEPLVTEYTTETTNATNTLTASPATSGATVVVTVDDTELSGNTITWGTDGEHTVVITVTSGMHEKQYTIVVTKS